MVDAEIDVKRREGSCRLGDGCLDAWPIFRMRAIVDGTHVALSLFGPETVHCLHPGADVEKTAASVRRQTEGIGQAGQAVDEML